MKELELLHTKVYDKFYSSGDDSPEKVTMLTAGHGEHTYAAPKSVSLVSIFHPARFLQVS